MYKKPMAIPFKQKLLKGLQLFILIILNLQIEDAADVYWPVYNATLSLIHSGCGLIFTTSFGFQQATYDLAGIYPDINFVHVSGYLTRDNMATVFGKIHEARYLSGLVAGKMIGDGQICYLAAYRLPEVIAGINAFTLGMHFFFLLQSYYLKELER